MQKPGVHYALEGGESLKFGEVEAVYQLATEETAETSTEDAPNVSQASTIIIQKENEDAAGEKITRLSSRIKCFAAVAYRS